MDAFPLSQSHSRVSKGLGLVFGHLHWAAGRGPGCVCTQALLHGWGRVAGIHTRGMGRVQDRLSCMPHSQASGKMTLPSTHGHTQSVDTGSIPGSLLL